MDNGTIWKAEDYPASVGNQTWTMLREVTLDHRLDALREIALTLLHEVESLRAVSTPRHGDDPRLSEAVRRFESQLILAALEKTHGNQFRAALLLGVKHTTLNAKIKRYGIPVHVEKSENQFSDQEIAA
jgi:DNA-binding NtrC family response regulator